MNQVTKLTGQNSILRKPCEKDIDDRFLCGTTCEYVRMVGGDTRNTIPFTRADALRWYENISSFQFGWVIELAGKCIGSARLTVNEIDKRARYAIGIFDISKLNMGYGAEATGLVLAFAFNVLRLHRVDLRVLDYNKRAIACYEKCGFVKEGVEREDALIEGKWESDIMMSILEQEYRNRK